MVIDSVQYLKQTHEKFKVYESDSNEAKKIQSWLEKSFSIVSWGRIDWVKIEPERKACYIWENSDELIANFDKICIEREPHNQRVYLFWSNMLKPTIALSLEAVIKHNKVLLAED